MMQGAALFLSGLMSESGDQEPISPTDGNGRYGADSRRYASTAAQSIEVWQLFSDADHIRSGRYRHKMTLFCRSMGAVAGRT